MKHIKITYNLLKEKRVCSEALYDFYHAGVEGIDIWDLIKLLNERKDPKRYTGWLFNIFKLTGTYYNWYPNGLIREITQYKNGLLHGESILYNENGSVYDISYFKNDEMHGPSYNFDNNRELLSVENYKNGEKHGHQFYYKNNKFDYME